MPGIFFAGVRGQNVPTPGVNPYLMANSLTGTGTPPAAAVQAGDLVALTTKSTLTSGGQVVLRMLLAADKSAHYKEGTPVAGILGIATDAFQSNASGVATAPPTLAGIASGAAISYPLSNPGMWGQDAATNRSYGGVILFQPGNIFGGRLDTGSGTVTLKHQYDNTLAGFILSTTSGVTTFTIDVSAGASDQCLRILFPDEQDPLYNTTVAQNAAGPTVFFELLDSFSQSLTGVSYSTQ